MKRKTKTSDTQQIKGVCVFQPLISGNADVIGVLVFTLRVQVHNNHILS